MFTEQKREKRTSQSKKLFHTTQAVFQSLNVLGTMVHVSITHNTGNISLVVPFWWRPLLFNLGKDTFGLVVGAVCA
jgi:hypothetical protein